MKRHLALAVLVGVVLAGSFAAAAWATTTLGYAPCCGASGSTLSAGEGYGTGWTGLGWIQNYMKWSHPYGGAPGMCSNYEDTSHHTLMMDKCSNSGIEDDARYEGNYAAAICFASRSNAYLLLLSNADGNGHGCWATHNT
jgi:hypothetical protein